MARVILRYRLPAALAVGLCLAAPLPAAGQDAPLTPDLPSAPPYDAGLLRLSEILGGLHYLRDLCGSDEGTRWRDQMQALINAEAPEGERRARFIDRFNRGYESFRTVYLTCTPAAREATDRYLDEGRRISRDIAARYGKEE